MFLNVYTDVLYHIYSTTGKITLGIKRYNWISKNMIIFLLRLISSHQIIKFWSDLHHYTATRRILGTVSQNFEIHIQTKSYTLTKTTRLKASHLNNTVFQSITISNTFEMDFQKVVTPFPREKGHWLPTWIWSHKTEIMERYPLQSQINPTFTCIFLGPDWLPETAQRDREEH